MAKDMELTPRPKMGRHSGRSRFTRRALIKCGGAAMGSMLIAALATACRRGPRGDGDNTPTTPVIGPAGTGTPSPVVGSPEPDPTPTAPPADQTLYRAASDAAVPGHHCAVESALWASLLTVNADLEPVADWAERWDANADATQWTFYLRQDNQGWSNGDPVTAHDFVWSWQRALRTGTDDARATLLYPIRNAEEIHRGEAPPETLGGTARDDWTLEVELARPGAFFPAIAASLALAPSHRATTEHLGDGPTAPRPCVSNGPFMLVGGGGDAPIELVKHADFWDANAIIVNRVIAPTITADQGLLPYEQRNVDILPVPDAKLADVRATRELTQQLRWSVEAATWMLVPQVAAPPFDDHRVRTALSHAIDRERLVQLTFGRVRAAQTLVPPGMPGHFDDSSTVSIQQFDVDQAFAALAGTAYAGGQNWPPVTLTMVEGDQLAQTLAQDVVAQLAENLGLVVTLNAVAPDAFEAAAHDQTLQLTWLRWDFTYPDPHNGYGDLFSTRRRASFPSRWSDPHFEDLVARGAAEQGEARLAIYQECEHTLQHTVAYIPIAYPVTYYLSRPWVQDVPTNRFGALPSPRLFPRLASSVWIADRPAPASP